MTIKDKLAHYEPKPLGEKGRYAVLLPLIYDVKTGKYQVPLPSAKRTYFSTGWDFFSWWTCGRRRDFSRGWYKRNLWGVKPSSWSNWHLGRDWLSDSSGENHPLLCWKDKDRKLGVYPSEWRGRPAVYSWSWHIVDKRTDLLYGDFYLKRSKRFSFFPSKKQGKI